MKKEFFRNILLSYLVLLPLLLAGTEYYLISALLVTIVISVLKIRQTEKFIRKVAEVYGTKREGGFEKESSLKKKDDMEAIANEINETYQKLTLRIEEIEKEKHNIEAIIRNMTDGVMLIDTKGKILLCNSALKNFFGVESEIEGRSMVETLRNAELMELIGRIIGNKETISTEIKVSYPRELYLMVNAIPFYSSQDRETISGAVLTIYDITRLKHLEEMRKDFVANVSHEIKTPITAIKGFSETLIEGAIEDRENARRFLHMIKNHSERINNLVDDLLMLSRIELGDIVISKTEVSIDEIIDTVFETLEERAEKKGLKLSKEVNEKTRKIHADKDRLLQIIINLVDNGIKFTERGGVTVRARKIHDAGYTIPDRENHASGIVHPDYIEISVEDTGIGIPPQHLQRLGEKFYRVDKARSRELGGTGLGLAIVKQLVKAHGWDMGIESTPGKGTKVKILIPAVTKV